MPANNMVRHSISRALPPSRGDFCEFFALKGQSMIGPISYLAVRGIWTPKPLYIAHETSSQ